MPRCRTVRPPPSPRSCRAQTLPPATRIDLVAKACRAHATARLLPRRFMPVAGAGLFCGVGAKVITPNLNEHNLKMEYCPYAPTATPPPLPALLMRIMRACGVCVGRDSPRERV